MPGSWDGAGAGSRGGGSELCVLGQSNGNTRLPVRGRDFDRAVVREDELANDQQAEAEPTGALPPAPGRTERIEELRKERLGDGPRVLHVEPHVTTVGAVEPDENALAG